MNEEENIDDGLKMTDDSREQSIVDSQQPIVEPLTTYNLQPTTQMEVHHHPHVEKKSFKEYLLEGLMIFLAVSMGFIAENIREHISDNAKEKEFIESLVEDLKEDQKNFTEMINYFDSRTLMIDSLINLINAETPIKNTSNFYFWGRTISKYSPVIVNTSTIDEIKFGSNFRLIKKKHLTKKIIEYYNYLPYVKEYETRLSQVDWDFRHASSEVVDAAVLLEMFGRNNQLHKLNFDPPLRNQTKDNLSKIAYYGHGMLTIRLAVQGTISKMQQNGKNLLDLIQKEYHLEHE